jgi:hypothetical protein
MVNAQETVYHLTIGVGIDVLKLGSNRIQVLGQLGPPDLSEDTGYGLKDFYDDSYICLHIEYTYEGICEGILVSPPCRLAYQGIDLLNLTWEQALQWVRNLDPDVRIDEDDLGFKSFATQICGRAKLLDDWVVESVLIFAKNYWPSEEEKSAVRERNRAENPPIEDAEAYLQALMNEEFNAEMD